MRHSTPARPIAQSRPQCLYQRVAGRIGRLIEDGTLRPGDRLPSLRKVTHLDRVSLTTSLQAYALLESRGLIEARPQSGYYVRSKLSTSLPEPNESSPGPDPTQVSIRELVMMVMKDTQNPHLVQLGAAIPHPDLVATEKLNRIMASVARETGTASSMYDLPPGSEELRIQIAQRAAAAGCHLMPNDIVTTSGDPLSYQSQAGGKGFLGLYQITSLPLSAVNSNIDTYFHPYINTNSHLNLHSDTNRDYNLNANANPNRDSDPKLAASL